MAISFGDNVRVRSTPETVAIGLAGLAGQVYGETRPSATGVEVIGATDEDHAVNVAIEGRADPPWFAPGLLEFVDHGPGTEVVIGTRRLVRSASGEWIEPVDA